MKNLIQIILAIAILITIIGCESKSGITDIRAVRKASVIHPDTILVYTSPSKDKVYALHTYTYADKIHVMYFVQNVHGEVLVLTVQ